jgi:hypothetical protein
MIVSSVSSYSDLIVSVALNLTSIFDDDIFGVTVHSNNIESAAFIETL